jgi:hypothetical protein
MVKVILIIVIMAILMEDGSSIKKTAEEEREDAEIAAAVNRTLAEEEKKRKEDEEKRQEDKKNKQKNRLDQEKKQTGAGQEKGSGTGSIEKEKGQDEACPTFNRTCPEQEPCPTCPEVTKCPVCELCPEFNPCLSPEVCPEPKDCPEVEVCSPVKCDPCPSIKCKTCGPEIVDNSSVVLNKSADVHHECPAPPSCTDAGMSVPTALVMGACAGGLLTGVAAVLGLVLRYASPIESGFVFLATFVITWYLCSHYPETARELGGRAATLLREAVVALGHRVMEALQRHNEQVSFS